MKQPVFREILEQIKDLEIAELQELDKAIQHHLADKKELIEKNAFHQSLLSSGLVKQIRQPHYRQVDQQQLIQVQGQPLSETIIEERR